MTDRPLDASGAGAALRAALPAPRPGLRGVVVLPARNEADHLDATLAALASQHDGAGQALDRDAFEVVLLANNCDDDSAPRARRFAAAHPDLALHVVEVWLPPPLANIGHVRRSLMDEACGRLETAGTGERAILSTDGDTRVAADWIARTLQVLRGGADAVGGRILTDGAAQPTPRALRIRRLDAAWLLLRSQLASRVDPEPHDPWPRHHQHFGASLAVTAAAYRDAGGMPEVPYLEDEALVRALWRVDRRVRHSPAVRVTTSGRLDGRAAVGLSWQLRQWADDPEAHGARPVDAVPRLLRVLEARGRLRGAWAQRCGPGGEATLRATVAASADRLGVDGEAAHRAFGAARHFGAAWEAVEALHEAGAGDADRVPLAQAVVDLRRWLRQPAARLAQPGATKVSSRYCA